MGLRNRLKDEQTPKTQEGHKPRTKPAKYVNVKAWCDSCNQYVAKETIVRMGPPNICRLCHDGLERRIVGHEQRVAREMKELGIGYHDREYNGYGY